MGSVDTMSSFPVMEDTKPENTSIPAFMVSTTRGFLPRADPVVKLPSEFDPLESILSRMPIKTLSGEPGLLAEGKLGDAVKDLPDLTDAMNHYKDNLPLMNALYRDYSFLASAYLLEPCHLRFIKGEPYGLGRQVLPSNIALPIARCAELSGFKPFMEYAGSYALFNYRLEDPNGGMDYSNLRLIRAFEHGLDPTSSEAGFVLVHVDMVKNSGPLVAGTVASLDACADVRSSILARRQELNSGLESAVSALTRINAVMESMWGKSKPRSYTSFRTFIFGITSQSMFPDGVIYEGLNDGKPVSFRGESGANDSMVPLMDNLLQVPMPNTPLTAILNDFRSYRPSNHREFLLHVRERSLEVGLKKFALSLESNKADMSDDERAALRTSRQLWLAALDQVRDFRWRHWCFAKEYILKQTSHPTATGGSPIVTWLPNQLQAVLDEMVNIYDAAEGESGAWDLGESTRDLMDHAKRQKETLEKEVARYCEERGVKRE